jgi:hypothetical protein
MPKALYEHYFQDLQYAFEGLQDVLAKRGLYFEASILFISRASRAVELRDVAVELIVRRRASTQQVWRGVEGLRVPGRAKLRPLASVLFGLMTRAAVDIEEMLPVSEGDRPQQGGRARS